VRLSQKKKNKRQRKERLTVPYFLVAARLANWILKTLLTKILSDWRILSNNSNNNQTDFKDWYYVLGKQACSILYFDMNIYL
jgi:hypothetical protein